MGNIKNKSVPQTKIVAQKEVKTIETFSHAEFEIVSGGFEAEVTAQASGNQYWVEFSNYSDVTGATGMYMNLSQLRALSEWLNKIVERIDKGSIEVLDDIPF